MKKRRLFVAIDFSKYRGRYVAIVSRRIVASGYDAQQVWHEAKRKYPHAKPELLKVSKGETLVLPTSNGHDTNHPYLTFR